MKKDDRSSASHHAHTSTSASVDSDQSAVSSEALRNLRAIEDAAAEGWAKHGGSIRGTSMSTSSISLLTKGSASVGSLATRRPKRR